MGNMRLRKLLRDNRAVLAAEAAARPVALAPVPADRWPPPKPNAPYPVEVFWNRQFLVQVFNEATGLRITVCRTTVNKTGEWDAEISWDDLQQVKHEAGYGECWAVELFPPDQHVVNVANMRHLWLLEVAPRFGWRRSRAAGAAVADTRQLRSERLGASEPQENQ